MDFKALLEAPWWVGFFWGVGLLAVATAVVSLFFALGRRPTAVRATQSPAVDSPDFLSAAAGLVNGTAGQGGTARLLNNGEEIFPALLTDVRAARHSVNWLAYIWEPGACSDEVFAALIERARAGVEVRVLLDGLGGMRCPEEGKEELKKAGGRIATFRPLRWGKLTRFHKRNHRRAIVVDGLVGYTGGVAVGDKWLGNARNPKEWRDSMVRVTGGPARDLQSHFAEDWAAVTGEILVGEAFYPRAAPDHGPADGHPPMRHIAVASSPGSEQHPMRYFFLLTFLAARRRLYLASPYFVPDEHWRHALVRLAKQGVDVRILLPNRHSDAKPIRLASHRCYDELLSAGVRIWEYQPTMMHGKLVVVDGCFSVVGSANLDIRSKELNEENVLGILDPGLAAAIERSLLADFERSSEFVLERWRRRRLTHRVLERLTGMLAEQF
ncbi:MAG TPA: phospholipase D-like domain-containing protein [Vicinamibacteria bacterium]|nr:phospholipase D-like domain-containing protein [Vicinamibacteria bacterium]